jgi:dienelactone hydrolase
MKTKFRTAAAVALLLVRMEAFAQTSLPHTFARIGFEFDPKTFEFDTNLTLTLTGPAEPIFWQYFDLYPIDASADLVIWKPLTTLLSTNASTDPVLYLDSESAQLSARFYRTVTNHLITPIVKPTGPYPVGRFSRLLNDPSRTNRYNVPTNSSFMVSYWYPAEAEAGQLPDVWEDKPLAEDSFWWSGYNDRVPFFVAHALPGARIATNESKYPVVLYVHGSAGTRAENLEKFEDLASHGYIVISADHWEGYGTVFPDGTYLHGSSVYTNETIEKIMSDPDFARFALGRRIQDLHIVLADLDRGDWADFGIAPSADTNKIGLLGYGFGAGVAGEMCRTNDRCRAFLGMAANGYGADELVRVGLQKPFLLMTSFSDAGYQYFFDKATNNAVWFVLSGTDNYSFLYGYETKSPSTYNREAQFTMKAYILSFFNKYLKSQDDHLLDGPSTNFPRVTEFQRK